MTFTSLLSTLTLMFAVATAAAPVHAAGSDLDSRPVPVKTPPPVYPNEMRRDGIAGLVTVKVVIDEKGNVAECTVNKSTRSEFESAALAAIREWKFRPASKDGSPVRAQMIIPIKFTTEA